MTALTDLVLAAMAFYFACGLYGEYGLHRMLFHRYFSFAFWMLGIGAFLGAVSHGAGPSMSKFWKSTVRKLTMLSIGFSTFLMLTAALHHAFPAGATRFLGWMAAALLFGYVVLISMDDRYVNVIRFYVPVMVFILILMLYSYFSRSLPGAGMMSVGLGVSFIAAGVQRSCFSLHRHLNHNDIYHIIQMGALYFLYRGGMLLKDYAG
jgi:hypothetical protein